jgi:hypothetical protein
MVPEPAVRPPWADPEALVELLDELRKADYKIGLDEYAAAQDLLCAFAAAGVSLDEADRFRDHLGPLVCSSLQEQEEFRERFAGWLARRSGGPAGRAVAPDARIDRITHEAHRIERGQKLWTRAIAGAALVAVAALVWVLATWLPSFSTPAEPLPRPSPEELKELPEEPGFPTFLVGTALMALLVAASSAWWRWRAGRFLVRRSSQGPVELTRISVATPAALVFPPPLLARLARDLRRRQVGPSTELDVPATLMATLRGGGWLTPVYGTRQLMPEYLVLIDRAGHADQQARLAEELMDRLARQGVLLTRYSFRSDPRICFPLDRVGAPVTLRELASRCSSHRLLLVTDGSPLFNPRTGELADWTDQLLQWEHRTLLTPEAPERWSSRETALARCFHVLPVTVEGWSRFARQVRTSAAARPLVPSALPFPEPLRLHPQRFLDRNPPDAETTEDMLAALRRYLGDGGFFWLSACAVYPVLDWRLTLYLGEVLAAPEGGKLLTPDRLFALVRTPWLRQGFMPDWLRLRLITGMSPGEERQVREALAMMLTTALNGPVDGLALEIARPHRKALASLAGQLLRSRKAVQGGLPEERVFRSFMDNRLAVRLPSGLRGHLRARPAPATGLRLGNPWENRRKIGRIRAYFSTLRLFLFSPRRAYDLTQERGDVKSAISFAVVTSALAAAPTFFSNAWSAKWGESLSTFTSAFLSGIIQPIFLALLLHGALRIARGLDDSKSGFAGSYRVTCYAMAPYIWQFLFFLTSLLGCLSAGCLGPILWYPWMLVLTIYGMASLHRTSRRHVFRVLLITVLLVVGVLWLLSSLS